MNKSVGVTYAIAGAVVAASLVVATGATLGLGLDRGRTAVEATGGVLPAGLITGAAAADRTSPATVVPAATLQPGEQVVSSTVVETATGPVEVVTVAPASARSLSREHEDDADDDEHEHEEREHRTSLFRRERD
ncbi:MAG: hypothetical protein WC273_00080 [Dehalococcoidia bacterium]